MAEMTPEGKIQARAIEYAEKRGCVVQRNHMGRGAATGRQDVQFLPGGGYVFFIEFKAPGKKARPRQEYLRRRLIQRGYESHVIDNFEDARRVIDQWVDSLAELR